MLYNFDVLFIIKPLDEDKILEEIEKIKDVISEKGELLKVDLWGRKKLAYEIKDYKYGFYGLINFNMDKYLTDKLSEELRANNSILRYMFIRKGDLLE